MEESEARRKLKGLKLIVHNRHDRDVLAVFDQAEAYIAAERPAPEPEQEPEPEPEPKKKRKAKAEHDRMERGGIDREDE